MSSEDNMPPGPTSGPPLPPPPPPGGWDPTASQSVNEPVDPQRWYENTALVVVALLVFSVFGLVLVWLKRQWSTTTKVIITAAVAGLLVYILLSAAGESSEEGLVAAGPIPAADAHLSGLRHPAY